MILIFWNLKLNFHALNLENQTLNALKLDKLNLECLQVGKIQLRQFYLWKPFEFGKLNFERSQVGPIEFGTPTS